MENNLPQTINDRIKKVHLIFKTHLDIGFTDYASNVIDEYFTYFIPKALRMAEVLRMRERPERLIWTTGSWLIYDYLERTTPSARKRMEAGILAGDIVWHGMPFTVHSELMDPSLFRAGLRISQTLDRRFGKETLAAKMTDVPGHTRSIIPLLAEAGIHLLHIGVNSAIMPPDVPPIFVWKAPGGEEIMVMYHLEYGGMSEVPGMDEVLLLEMTNDNLGPSSLDAILETFHRARTRFPQAVVEASTLNAYARLLLQRKASLPVVTEEIGDTWIYGVGCDPGKVSRFRELSRLRRRWLEDGRVERDSPSLTAFSHSLLLVAEHTWGMDEKKYLGDEKNYRAAQFAVARKLPHFQAFEASWEEQRAYLDAALVALEPSLAQEARAHLAAIAPKLHATANFTQVSDVSQVFDTSHFRVGIDAGHGALIHLEEQATGRQWASPDHPLGLFRYEIFSHREYERYVQQYVRPEMLPVWWVQSDLTKPGLEKLEIEAGCWEPHLTAVYQRQDEQGQQLLLMLTMPEEIVTTYGAPRSLTLLLSFPNERAHIHFDLSWFEKPACRIPEALWFSFTPQITEATGWRLDKMGQSISPLEVRRNGNRRLHAVGTGVTYRDASGALELETLDAPLVAPGERSLLNFTNEQPQLLGGIHFNLLNNLYGTNFRMWYDEDARFRFLLRVQRQEEEA